MLPENNTGKDAEAVARIYAIKMTKQYRTPNNKMRISKAISDNYPTNKVDPTIGSTRKENRDRNPVEKNGTITDDVEHIEIQRKRALKVDERKRARRYKTGR